MIHSPSSVRHAGLAAAGVAALMVGSLAAGTSYASGGDTGGSSAESAVAHRSTRASVGRSTRDVYVDVTDRGGASQTRDLRTAGRILRQPATMKLQASLPSTAVLDISGSTGTVRWLGNLDGALTRPSSRTPKHVAMRFVRRHLSVLGLSSADLQTFHLHRNYRDIAGTHHLYFTQKIGGSRASRNGLTASVGRSGRLLTLGGIPINTSTAGKLPPASAPTITTAAEALARTRGPETPAADTSEDTATRVVFATDAGLRPAWETVVTSSETPATTVIDAVTGRVLQRTPLRQYEHSTGRAYRFFPGSHRGGHQIRVDFTKRHWLGKHAHVLRGNNAHAYSDVNDNNRPSHREEVHPRTDHHWSYHLKPFHLGFAKRFCSNPWPCSWNPNKPFSWQTNRAQDTTQVFYFVNNWHDHLRAAPVGFTEAAGNFQRKNHSKRGRGGDPVTTQTDDGANTLIRHGKRVGLPDGAHIDNANMSTPPDGKRPRMQMYLQHTPGTPYGYNGDPFSPTNVGDEADTVYHEYTHGLSNRLNVDVRGRSTLGPVQAGAMGEGWSDWYAMDYLVKKHFQRDRARKADVRLFIYDGLGVNFDRTEPIDCKVGQATRLCNGGATSHRGGYTYRDYGQVVGGPEVHGDGEIWSQTLWDLRRRLGSRTSEALVTRAMELAPYNPSFVDMRNAILVADTAVYHSHHHAAIWKVFAHRGLGFHAGSLGGNDTHPAPSFDLPPANAVATGTIAGTVSDKDSGHTLAGITLTLVFGGAGSANPTTVTDSTGHFSMPGIPLGHYDKLLLSGHGYQAERGVTVEAGTTPVNPKLRFDWAGPKGGGQVVEANGRDYTFIGCGPDAAIDGSQSTGWSTNAGRRKRIDGTEGFGRKHMTIRLAQPITVKGFAVDPTGTCGDDPTSSTAGYKIQTSTSPTVDETTVFTTVATGTFTGDDNHRLNTINLQGPSGVQLVRFVITSDQVPDFTGMCGDGGGPSGCHYVDLTELQVFGIA